MNIINQKILEYRDVIYIVSILLLVSLLFKQCERSRELLNIIDINEELKVKTKKDGTTISTTEVYETDPNTFKKVNPKTPQQKKLQEEVNNKTKSATVISTETVLDTLVPLKDSVRIENLWTELFITKRNDSLKIDLISKNEFIIHVKQEGFFKDKVKVDVISYNPTTKVKTVHSYFKKNKAYNWGIGPVIGAGFSHEFKPAYFVGIGVQFNIIRL